MKNNEDEASRLWKVLEKKREGKEKGMRWGLAVALVLGLALLFVGLWIVAFR